MDLILLRKNRGQSLVQTVVGIGLMAILALAMAEMNRQSMMAQTAIRYMNEMNNVGALISTVLQAPSLCNNNFPVNLATDQFLASGITATGGPQINLQRILYPDGTVVVAPNQNIAVGLVVSSLKLEITKELEPGTRYMAKIILVASKQEGTAVGSQVSVREIPTVVQTEVVAGSTRQIKGCTAGPLVTTYVGNQNLGAHTFCALSIVQNGWETSIGNNQLGVYKQDDGTWLLTGAADGGRSGAVCLDL